MNLAAEEHAKEQQANLMNGALHQQHPAQMNQMMQNHHLMQGANNPIKFNQTQARVGLGANATQGTEAPPPPPHFRHSQSTALVAPQAS